MIALPFRAFAFVGIASLLLLSLASNVKSFSPQQKAIVFTKPTNSRISNRPLFMSDKPETVTSGKKEIAYDEDTGRFYETGIGEGECIPEDEFCYIEDKTGKSIRLTVEEKERIFLDALQSYYSSGRQLLKDDEFDILKKDLEWNGSDMVVMNRKETQFLAAKQQYLKGSPIMDDKEFDELKKELSAEGSRFAVESEPKCYIDTGICKATMKEDNFRSNLLYLPAGTILAALWLGIGYEIIAPFTKINPLVLLVLGAYPIYKGCKYITEDLVFQNKLIAFGACPSCGFENRVYFGDILGVDGFGEVASIKCPNCKDQFRVQRSTLRASTLPKD